MSFSLFSIVSGNTFDDVTGDDVIDDLTKKRDGNRTLDVMSLVTF